jgi:hypothetical protein
MTAHNSQLPAELLSSLQTLESERQASQTKKHRVMCVIIGIFGGVGGMVAVVDQTPAPFFIGAVIATIVSLIVAGRFNSKVFGPYKGEVMPILVGMVHPSLQYDQHDCISSAEFESCGMFISPDRYTGQDLITGQIGATDIRFSAVFAEEEYEVTDTETDTDSDGNTTTRTVTRTEYRTIFSGMFFSADFNKNFKGRTVVMSGAPGFWSKRASSSVALEDPRFNDPFHVSSSDQVEVRYILTPNLMERLVSLKARFGGGSMAFYDGRVCIALPLPYGLFNPCLDNPLTDTAHIKEVLKQFRRIIGVVDDLDLNTRIWTKGGRGDSDFARVVA